MAHRNMALFIAATNLTELLERMGADVPADLRETHKFAIAVADGIGRGLLNGQGTVEMMDFLNAAYADATVAYWEALEEKHLAQQRMAEIAAKQVEAARAAEAAERKPESLDEVLADRPPMFRKGDRVVARAEMWASELPGTVTNAVWRDEASLRNWCYTLVMDNNEGTYAVVEGDLAWDIDHA